MLHLKRIQYFNEFRTCSVSGELMSYGDFYYEDDTDGVVIKATVYRDLRDQYREDTFDETRLNQAKSEEEYKAQLKRYEQEFLTRDVLERKVFSKEEN